MTTWAGDDALNFTGCLDHLLLADLGELERDVIGLVFRFFYTPWVFKAASSDVSYQHGSRGALRFHWLSTAQKAVSAQKAVFGYC
jgi:hypothetical protein